jgi:hypothetical protein
LVRREGFVEELLEERMRKTMIFAAAAGLTIGCLGASGASAMTSTSPAGLRVAIEAMDSSTLVHCRPYRHWHPWGYGHGCRGGGVSVEIRRGHRVGVEERGSIRSRTTTRGETSVRGSTSTKTETKSGASTTSKSGTSTGGSTSGGQGGEKSSSGGSSGGMSGSSGGTSGGRSGGQKQ